MRWRWISNTLCLAILLWACARGESVLGQDTSVPRSLPDEIFLVVGQPFELEIPENAVLFDPVPQGVTLEEGKLRWTPDAGDLGKHFIGFKTPPDDNPRGEWIIASVQASGLRIADLSGSASRAIIIDPSQRWGVVAIGSNVQTWHVVDLESWKFVAAREFPAGWQWPCFDGDRLLLIREHEAVHELPLPNLDSLLPLSKPYLPGAIHVGNKWVIAPDLRAEERSSDRMTRALQDTWDQGGPLRRYRHEDHVEEPFPELMTGMRGGTHNGAIHSNPSELLGRPFGDGWIFGGVLYDKDLTTPQLLLRPWGLLAPSQLNVEPVLRQQFFKYDPFRAFQGGERVSLENKSLIIEAEHKTRMHPLVIYPDASWFQYEVKWRDRENRPNSSPLCIAPDNKQLIRSVRFQDGFVVFIGDQIVRWSPPDDFAKEYSERLRFDLQQSELELDAAGTTMMTHRVRGGSPPYEFSLEPMALGSSLLDFTINATTGDVTIDGPKVVEAMLRYHDHRFRDAKTSEIKRDYLPVAESRYRELTGREPTGVPVLLGLTITATDSKGAEAKLTYELLLQLPKSRWLVGVDKARSDRLEMIAREAAILSEETSKNAAENRREYNREYLKQALKLSPPTRSAPWFVIVIVWAVLMFGFTCGAVLQVPISTYLLHRAWRFETRWFSPYDEEPPHWPELLRNVMFLGIINVLAFAIVSALLMALGNWDRWPELFVVLASFIIVFVIAFFAQRWLNIRISYLSYDRAHRIAVIKSLLMFTIALLAGIIVVVSALQAGMVI